MDGDVIFTDDSYLPRRASLNLTLDLFDKSLNVLELGGEFKPGIIESEEETDSNLQTHGKDGHDNKISVLQRLFNQERTRNEVAELEREGTTGPKASMFVRLFGDEVVYLDDVLDTNPLQFLQKMVKEFSSPKSFKVRDTGPASLSICNAMGLS